MLETYAGLDVSDKQTHLCVMDGAGVVLWRGRAASDVDVLARALRRHAPGLVRAVIESGPLSNWLVSELRGRGLPVLCICARQAKGALSARGAKSDALDAEGLGQLARTGWYREVRVKAHSSRLDRSFLKVRGQLVKAHGGLVNQLRGTLKTFGLKLGAVTTPARREARLAVLLADEPELAALVAPLRAALAVLGTELDALACRLESRVAEDRLCRRLMSVPGVGPVTALTFVATIEEPGRFARAAQVAAYAGLVPRLDESGELRLKGRITKRGDAMLRHALYEAANSLLGRLKRPCTLKRWGLGLQQAKGAKHARVAVARKLAMILYRLWRDGSNFRWQAPQTAPQAA